MGNFPFGGTVAQGSALIPGLPLLMSPVKWCLFNYDRGPDTINAAYAPGTIMFNTGSTVAGGGSQVASVALAVPAGVKVGDLMLVLASFNVSFVVTPTLTAASGHTWTQVGTTLTQTTSGWTVTGALYKRVATSGDAGDTLTIGPSSGTAFMGASMGAWTGAADVDVFTTAAPPGNLSGTSFPAVVTGPQAGDNVVYAAAAVVNGTGAPVLSGAFTSSVQPTLPSQAANGNVAILADSGAVYPGGTTTGTGVSIAGSTNTQFVLWSAALRPAAPPVPATLTANANGILAIDGGSPAVGDRVLVADPFAGGTGNPPFKDGIYTVTNVGSAGTPWVLTRAADMQTNAAYGQYWAVQITNGTVMGGGQAQVLALGPVRNPPPPAIAWTFLGIGLAAASGYAPAPWGTAGGASSTVSATQGSAAGSNAVSAGDSTQATGNHSWAGGSYANALGGSSQVLGRYATTGGAAVGALALGESPLAYSPDQIAFGGALIGTTVGAGNAQSSRVQFGGQTTSATPVVIAPVSGTFTLQDINGAAYWKRTVVFRGRIVARRTDTPGTDSAWSFQGVLRGNGSSAYTWIGGTAPSLTLIAQDAGAAAWTAAWAISSNTVTLTVTGAAATTIDWECTLELDEVAG